MKSCARDENAYTGEHILAIRLLTAGMNAPARHRAGNYRDYNNHLLRYS